ncbi:MAG: AAA family ATPase [Planctomycetes bacterium]|nr:AAA family ATPase [Planctomycetota bacterium]
MYKIVITEGTNQGSHVSLRGETVLAGRSMGCGLRLPDHGVSREHTRFRRDGETWFVEDLGSRNGTRLNGRRVEGSERLTAGDRVQIGSVTLQVVAGEGTNGHGSESTMSKTGMGVAAVAAAAGLETGAGAGGGGGGGSGAGGTALAASATAAAHAEVSADEPTAFLPSVGGRSADAKVGPGQPAKGEVSPARVPATAATQRNPSPAGTGPGAVAPATPAAAAAAGAPAMKFDSLEAVRLLREAKEKILAEVQKVIIGQKEVIEHILISMFSRGHCLVVGVPGLAKTLMVRTIASVLDLDFKRIQFTPDLMPSDITGTDILEEDPETHERNYKFIRGPIFANIILADEINRTPPKTQAALLEAMQEYRVTASGYSYELKQPFFVLATQNPIEQEGTYPLPEAQLDRFMFSIQIGYPTRDEEVAIVKATTQDQGAAPRVVLSAQHILDLQKIVRKLPVSDYVVTFATHLVRTTRPKSPEALPFINDFVAWGAGPRAAQCLVLGAKARAILDGRVNVSCNDVRAVAPIVLRHRLFTNFNADSEGITAEDVIQKILKAVPDPSEKDLKKA